MPGLETTAPPRATPPRATEETIRPATWMQVAAVLAGLAAFVLAANFAARVALDRDSRNLGYWLVHEKWSRLLALDHPVDWLILGDSSGNQALMPSALTARFGGQGINLCTVGNMVAVGDVWMLQNYLQRFGPPRHVVIVHVYDMWHRPLQEALVSKIPLPWGFWRHLDPPVAFSLRQQVSMFEDRYVPLYAENLSLISLIEHPHEMPIGPIHMRANGFMETSMIRPENVAAEAAQDLRDMAQDPPIVTAQNRAAIARISALADQYGFDVYLANSPLYAGLYDNPAFRTYYQQVVRAVREAIPPTDRMHYLLQQPVTMPIDQLQGVDHVTAAGARVYSAALADAIAHERSQPAVQGQ